MWWVRAAADQDRHHVHDDLVDQPRGKRLLLRELVALKILKLSVGDDE